MRVNREQKNLQFILWEGNSKDAKLFQLMTVTYGTTSAPILASTVLKQLA